MCTDIDPKILWFRSIGTMYVLGILAWMFLWIASNDGVYAQHSSLLSFQCVYAGVVMGIWMIVMAFPKDNTVPVIRILIVIFFGAIATILANVLFAIWSLDLLMTKCQNPDAYGCVYVQICKSEQAYLISAIVFVIYLSIVDIIAIYASLRVLGKSYPSVGQQLKLASE